MEDNSYVTEGTRQKYYSLFHLSFFLRNKILTFLQIQDFHINSFMISMPMATVCSVAPIFLLEQRLFILAICWKNREFSYSIQGYVNRFLDFQNLDLFKDAMQRHHPCRFELGAVYNVPVCFLFYHLCNCSLAFKKKANH